MYEEGTTNLVDNYHGDKTVKGLSFVALSDLEREEVHST